MTPVLTPSIRVKSDSLGARWMLATALTGLTWFCAQLSAPLRFTPVPITMQLFAVLLSGLLLGRRWGTIAQIQYLMLGAAGLPVFALGRGGIGVIFGVTGGYLLSYPVVAGVAGWLSEARPGVAGRLLGCAAGLTVLYGLGCLWMEIVAQPILPLRTVLMMGIGWFLVFDCAKALLAVALVTGMKKRLRLEMPVD